MQQTQTVWQRSIRHSSARSIAFFFLGYLAIGQLLSLVSIVGGFEGHADFKQLYAAAYMVRTGHAHEIYNYEATERYERELVGNVGAILPFNHPSYEALLLAPLSLFSYKTAYLLFAGVNVVLLCAIFLQLRPYLYNYVEVWPPLVFAPFFFFYPVVVCIVQGQDSLFLLAAIVCSFLLEERRRHFLAGFVLAFGLFKFQFVIPIAVLFFLWRRWRFVAGFAAGAALWAGVSLAVTGLHSWKTYATYLLGMSAQLDARGQEMYGILPDHMANLRGLVSVLTPAHLAAGMTLGLSLLLLIWAAGKPASFTLATLVSVLVSYHAYRHDLTILILPLCLAASTIQSASRIQLVSMGLIFVLPTLMMFSDLPFWLLAIPILLLTFETAKQK